MVDEVLIQLGRRFDTTSWSCSCFCSTLPAEDDGWDRYCARGAAYRSDQLLAFQAGQCGSLSGGFLV